MRTKAAIVLGIILVALAIAISTFVLKGKPTKEKRVSKSAEKRRVSKPQPQPQPQLKGNLTVNVPLDIPDGDIREPKLLMTRSSRGGDFSFEAKSNRYFYILDGLTVKRISLDGKVETIYTRPSGSYELGGVAVDKDENVYIGVARLVWDGSEEPYVKDPEIKVYSPQKKLLRTIKMPNEVYVNPKISKKNHLFASNLHVHLRKAKKGVYGVYVFNLKGELITKVRFPISEETSRFPIYNAYEVDGKEYIYFGYQVYTGEKRENYEGIFFKKINLKGKVLKEMFIKTDENFPDFRFGFSGIDNQGHIYANFSKSYEGVDLRKYDIEGDLIKRFRASPSKGESFYIIPNGEVYLLQYYRQEGSKLYYLGK